MTSLLGVLQEFCWVGAGGVILDPRGDFGISYTWSLGYTTNNQVEEYTLLKGIQLAKEIQTQHIIIIGESLNTIQNMIKGTLPKDSQLCNLIKNIRQLLVGITQSSYHHVLRENNQLADS